MKGIEGTLAMLGPPALVQLIAQEGHQALIQIAAGEKTGLLYLNMGQVFHAEVQNGEDNLVGEEAVYEILGWKSGEFQVINAVSPPRRSIQSNLDFLLFESLRILDERNIQKPDDFPQEVSLDSSNDLSTISDTDTAILKEIAAQQMENNKMANIQETLQAVMTIDGAIAAALVDYDSGMTLGTVGSNNFDIDLAAAGNTNVVRAKLAVMKDLKLKGTLEDVLITLTEQYHLIRLLQGDSKMFLYLALRRDAANLGLARHRLNQLEKDLSL